MLSSASPTSCPSAPGHHAISPTFPRPSYTPSEPATAKERRWDNTQEADITLSHGTNAPI